MPTDVTLLLGDVVTPRDDGSFLMMPGGGLAVAEGRIVAVGRRDELAARYPGAAVRDHADRLLLPGLIDTHSHVAQFAISGAGQLPLFDWLERYVYPAETEFSDPAQADATRAACDAFYRESLAWGTTTTNTLATSSTAASEIALASADAAGVRALVGKVLMDFGGPEATPLLEDAAAAEQGLDRLRTRWHGRDGRLSVTVAPRGVFACSRGLLEMAAGYAARHDLLLHTHLDMVESFRPATLALFPWATDFLDIFERTGCVRDGSVFAHGTGLTSDEVARLAANSARLGAAHCGPSNLYWMMGLMPVRRLQAAGVAVGLGSDAGGGPTVSLFDAMRAAGDISRHVALETGVEPLTPADLLTLATLGGARTLRLDALVGSLEPGKRADVIVVRDGPLDPLAGASGGRLRSPYQSLGDRLSRVVYRPMAGMVKSAYIDGRCVFGAEEGA